MISVCPTVTATNPDDYNKQVNNVKEFASQIHIDLMDGVFAPSKSPELDQITWPGNLLADIHLMYQKPLNYLDQVIALRPHMVIIHLEAEADVALVANRLHTSSIKVGLGLLRATPVERAKTYLKMVDQVLIFSGNLGYHGGQADLSLITKVKQVKELNEELEIAWDGGINDDNAPELVRAGVSVLNVGGFVQDSSDPKAAYDKLMNSL